MLTHFTLNSVHLTGIIHIFGEIGALIDRPIVFQGTAFVCALADDFSSKNGSAGFAVLLVKTKHRPGARRCNEREEEEGGGRRFHDG